MDNHDAWEEEECEASKSEMNGVAFTGMFLTSVVVLIIMAIILS